MPQFDKHFKIFSNHKDYKTVKAIMQLAIPAIIENIAQVLIGVVDIFFVGKLGSEAIAGVGVTNLTMNVYIAFFIALGIGTSALIARFIGAGNYANADRVLKQSLILSLGIGLFAGLLSLLYAEQILSVLGAQQDVIDNALPYFIAVAVPSVFLCVNMILSSALRGAGNTKTPMRVAIIANVINAVLNYVLIFGAFGIPGFGILGAGLATTLARILSTILLINKMSGKGTKIKLHLHKDWGLDISMLRAIVTIGLPAAFERLIMRSGQLVYGSMIIKLGTEAYAAHNIAGTIESFSYLPGMGFGVAAATLVGQNLGRKDQELAQRSGLVAYYLSTIFMVVLGIVFFIFAPSLARLFTSDSSVVKQVVDVLRIIALFQPFLAITLVITSALQGAGDTKFPMYSSLIGIWGIRVLGVYILSVWLDYGLVGVWLAYAFDVTIRGSILMVRYLKGRWKTINIG